MTLPESTRESKRSDGSWWLFCLGIVSLKFLLLAADPVPKYFLGDSQSYLWTAIAGWIPPDRSYFYGYFIRWLSPTTHSLTLLLICQVLGGATIAILLAWTCRRVFQLPLWVSSIFGLLCSIDPLQLFWEHAVMAETVSLFFYAVLLQRAFRYLQQRRILDLVLIQVLSMLVIGFRMSYLVLVVALGLTLPLFAFLPIRRGISVRGALDILRSSFTSRSIVRPVLHWTLSIALMLALHTAYKRANGLLSHRQPEYLYGTGFHLLSCWAPALQPEDGADENAARLIQEGSKFNIKRLKSRPGQRFGKGGIVDRLLELEHNSARAEEVAKETAFHALKRNPLAIGQITAQTYLAFWNLDVIPRLARNDIAGFTPEDVTRMAQEFHQVVYVGPLNEQRAGWVAQYYVAAWPYYLFVLCSPVFLLLALIIQRPPSTLTLFVGMNLIVLFGSTFLFSIFPIVRYLHPLAFLALMSVAATIGVFYERAKSHQSRS
jgi:hypothetical protein